jgi:mannitol/fructose-specific phosphotransferase system IIA component (Ntr-type)
VEKKIKDKNAKIKKEKNVINLRKNTESNLINNIFSYVCSEMKSHKAVKKLLKTTERKKIFYIFMNNLKKLNNKYLNRKNVKALLDLEPD